MIESSSNNPLFLQRAADGGIAVKKVIVNGLMRVQQKFLKKSMRAGIFTRYKLSVHVSA